MESGCVQGRQMVINPQRTQKHMTLMLETNIILDVKKNKIKTQGEKELESGILSRWVKPL